MGWSGFPRPLGATFVLCSGNLPQHGVQPARCHAASRLEHWSAGLLGGGGPLQHRDQSLRRYPQYETETLNGREPGADFLQGGGYQQKANDRVEKADVRTPCQHAGYGLESWTAQARWNDFARAREPLCGHGPRTGPQVTARRYVA